MTNLILLANSTQFNPFGIDSGLFLGFILGFLVLFIIIAILLYIYCAWAWYSIAKKLGYKNAWLAWIPGANFFLLPILAKRNWNWGWIILAPIITSELVHVLFGIFIYILATVFVCEMAIIWLWNIYKLRGYPGWLSLIPILILVPILGIFAGIAHLIIIGLVAWKK